MPDRRALAAVLLVLCASCADAPGAPTAAAVGAEPLGLSAVAVYGRHAAVRDKVDVRLASAGDAPLEVVSFQLRTPLYETVPPLERLRAERRGSVEVVQLSRNILFGVEVPEQALLDDTCAPA